MLNEPLGNDEGPDAAGPGEDPLSACRDGPRGSGVDLSDRRHSAWHEDLAAYALGALDSARARRSSAPRRLRALPRRAALARARGGPACRVRRAAQPAGAARELMATVRARKRATRSPAAKAGLAGMGAAARRCARGRLPRSPVAGIAGYALRGGDGRGPEVDHAISESAPPATGRRRRARPPRRLGDAAGQQHAGGRRRGRRLPGLDPARRRAGVVETFRPDAEGEATATIPVGLEGPMP